MCQKKHPEIGRVLMEIIRHYACLANDELYDFFNRNKISFHQDEIAGKCRVYFDVLESDDFFPELMKIALNDCIVTKKVKHSKKEITNAQWLTCTPVTAKVNLANQDRTFLISEKYDTGKAHHRTLSGMPFYVSKSIAHNANQHFFASYEATNQLFCTEHAKSTLQKMNLPVSFDAVLNSKTDLPIGDLYAVRIHCVLPPEALDLSNSEETFVCPVCGFETFLPPLLLKVRGKFMEGAPGICRTEAVFGWGGNYAAPITLISHEVYLALAENHLMRGLEIEPISLI